jgi:hypothetical protein
MSPKRPLYLASIACLVVAGSIVAAACKSRDSQSVVLDSGYGGGGGAQDSYSDLTVSFYDMYAFSSACQAPYGVPKDNGVAVAEGVFGLQCKDNWVLVPDADNPQDVEPGDIKDAKSKGFNIATKRQYLEESYKKCGGRCVRKRYDGKFEINLPSCNMPGLSDACDGKIYEISTNQAKGSEKVYMHSVCPASHWKNLAKQAFGVDNNHCSHPHIDISTKLLGKLGLDTNKQNDLRVTIKLSGSGGSTQGGFTGDTNDGGFGGGFGGGNMDGGSSGGDRAPNGFPYCTNGSDNGGGWGWDESVMDPKGSHSCVVPTGTGGTDVNGASGGDASSGNAGDSTDTGGGTAPNGYPYCTNGSNDGNGWGWDEAVTDPSGSHSCVPR